MQQEKMNNKKLHLDLWNERGIKKAPKAVIDEILKNNLNGEYDNKWLEKIQNGDKKGDKKIVTKILKVLSWNNISEFSEDDILNMFKKEEKKEEKEETIIGPSGITSEDVKNWT